MTPDKTQHDKTQEERQASPKGSSLDEFSVFMAPRAPRRGLAARRMLFVGVAAACVLGVGLGIWARPAMSERQASVAPPADAAPKAAPAARRLAIIVDDRPAPVGAPIEVLPASAAPPQAYSPQTYAASRPAAPPPAPPAPPAAKPKWAPLVIAALLAPKPHLAPPTQAEPAKLKPAAPVHLAAAAPPSPKPAPKAAPKIDLAQIAKAKAAAHRLELAQAAKAAKAEREEHMRLAKAARQHQLELARAEAKGRAEAHAEARTLALAEARDDARKRQRLVSLVRVVQRAVMPHAVQARAEKHHPAPVKVAKLDRKHDRKAARHEPRVEQASARKAPARAPAPAYRVHAAPPPSVSGLMKVSATHCANRDPGEALVCADPSLGAADRQLNRAYQSARAAGVPDAQLRQQQQHWLSARSSAAREAPWAVHDVYLARIAELNGQAREAHPDGY